MSAGGGGECDLFSKLPDPLICLIMKLLPFKDAVATSALSKDWVSRWKTCRTLDLDLDTLTQMPYPGVPEFIYRARREARELEFMDRAKKLVGCHEGETLDNFRLSCVFSKKFLDRLDELVATALRKRAGRIEIDLSKSRSRYSMSRTENNYVLPASKISSWYSEAGCFSFLKHLALSGVLLGELRFSCFESLESFRLELSTLSQQQADDLLSTCNRLLSLAILKCETDYPLTLRIPPSHPLKHLNVLFVSAWMPNQIRIASESSNLESVHLEVHSLPSSVPKRLMLESFKKLKNLSLICLLPVTFTLEELAHSAPDLESLCLSSVLRGSSATPFFASFSMLRHVSLRDAPTVNFFPDSIPVLLKMSPVLHTLELYFERDQMRAQERVLVDFRRYCFRMEDGFSHENLKVVKMFSFEYCPSKLRVMLQILENAPNLDIIEIYGGWVTQRASGECFIDSEGFWPEECLRIKNWVAEKNVPFQEKLKFVQRLG